MGGDGSGDKLVPWVEKYRPRKLVDVSAQSQVVSALSASLESGQVPHLLFYGPPGTGKTSTIIAMCKELYGEHYKERVLELNASDERGISVVRDKVKTFAQTAVGSGFVDDGASGKRALPPFKLIILDESDSMTDDAQSALRRVMELYTRVTRFCLVCNYVSRIIEPLASRCAKFRFEPLPDTAFKAKIASICAAERVQMDDDSRETLARVAGGDLRRGITLLQTSSQYAAGDAVTSEVVLEMAGLPSHAFMQQLWAAVKSRRFADLTSCAVELQAQGFAVNAVIGLMQEQLLAQTDPKFSDAVKAKVLIKLAAMDKATEDGADEDLQFQALISACSQLYHGAS